MVFPFPSANTFATSRNLRKYDHSHRCMCCSSQDIRIDRPPRRCSRQSLCRLPADWSVLDTAMFLLLVCVCCVPILLSAAATHQLPNTTSIDGEFTAKLSVDHFFSLWIVFNNEDVTMSGKVLLLIVFFFAGGRLIAQLNTKRTSLRFIVV